MAMRIVAWPPVGIVSRAPWVERPVVRSEGLGSGRRAVASAGPERRVAQLSVSSLAMTRSGAGYMAQLWRELDGGINLVRVEVMSANWWLDRQAGHAAHGTSPLTWTTGGDPLSWTSGGDPLAWFVGPARIGTPGTDAQGYPTVTVTGLPPNALILRPDDVVRSHVVADAAWAAARSVTLVRSDGTGAATIRLDRALPEGVISLHDTESLVFEALSMQQAAQGVSGDWLTQVDLRELLPHEYAGAVEWDPW